MLVFLDHADFGIGYTLTLVNKRACKKFKRETGHESVLIQSDWDFPSLARDLGWKMPKRRTKSGQVCLHHSTDGTVNCPDCGMTASEFILFAGNYLDKKAGGVYQMSDAYFNV